MCGWCWCKPEVCKRAINIFYILLYQNSVIVVVDIIRQSIQMPLKILLGIRSCIWLCSGFVLIAKAPKSIVPWSMKKWTPSNLADNQLLFWLMKCWDWEICCYFLLNYKLINRASGCYLLYYCKSCQSCQEVKVLFYILKYQNQQQPFLVSQNCFFLTF